MQMFRVSPFFKLQNNTNYNLKLVDSTAGYIGGQHKMDYNVLVASKMGNSI